MAHNFEPVGEILEETSISRSLASSRPIVFIFLSRTCSALTSCGTKPHDDLLLVEDSFEIYIFFATGCQLAFVDLPSGYR